jgi:hypothetical protein
VRGHLPFRRQPLRRLSCLDDKARIAFQSGFVGASQVALRLFVGSRPQLERSFSHVRLPRRDRRDGVRHSPMQERGRD